jgi:murein tripeptide amidase MpaA
MLSIINLLTFVLVQCAPLVPVGNYFGNQLLRINYHANQTQRLNEIISGMDVWEMKSDRADVNVPAAQVEATKSSLNEFEYSVLIENLGMLIAAEKSYAEVSNLQLTSSTPSIFNNYQDMSAYVEFLSALPGITSTVLNTTYNGNTLTSFKFGSGPLNIVYVGGTHAREWISPALVTYLTWFLTGSSSEAVALSEQFTFTMIPVVNADGYAYTRKSDRMWRKNRQANKGSSCIGVDPNRFQSQ